MIQTLKPLDLITKLSHFERLLLVDVGPLSEYERKHLPKAIHLPAEDALRLAEKYLVDHGAMIVLYDVESTERAQAVAERLREKGYKTLFVLEGGRKAWEDAGEQTETKVNPAPGMTNPTFPTIIL